MGDVLTKTLNSPRAVGDLEAGVETELRVESAESQVPFYEKIFGIKNEIQVIEQFLMKLRDAKEESKTSTHSAEVLKTLRDRMDQDVKEVSKAYQSINEKFQQLDKAKERKGREEDSPTDQNFRDIMTGYITQLGEVRKVLESLAGVEMHSVHAADSPTDVDAAEVLISQSQGVPKRFTYNELFMATGGFCEKLGNGEFGSVYRGVLPPRIPVAVKRLNYDSTHGQSSKEFKGEVSIINQLSHRNLVELRGWCEDEERKEYMLLYELMPNKSLDKWLFKPVERGRETGRAGGDGGEDGADWGRGREAVKGMTCLSWPQRFKILTGTADALDYLHQGWKRQVIHSDIKCANILLDKEWNAKLADFGLGLSRMLDHAGKTYRMIDIIGSTVFGYIAQELIMEMKFTDKSDVYAFGAVLLEVACGRPNWPCHAHDNLLVYLVRESLRKGDLLSMVDKRLREYDVTQMKVVLMTGLACCNSDPGKRPSMRHVVQMLARDAQDELMKMIFDVEEQGLLQALKTRSVPADDGRVETEWVVQQVEPGVYMTLRDSPGGGKDMKRLRFSRKRFTERQAEQWWAHNRQRVLTQYNSCVE